MSGGVETRFITRAEYLAFVEANRVDEQVLETPATVSGEPELPGFRLDLERIWNPGF